MNAQTLVLDASYQPVARVSWRRAVTLLWESKVEIVETYPDLKVHSATQTWEVPSVIRFLKAVRTRKKVIKFARESVYARDRGRCQYCGINVPRSDFTYDHVKPRASGGQTNWTNVVICCTPCNQRKGGRTPEQARMKLITEPVKPKTLPKDMLFRFEYERGMPEVWKTYLRSVVYWAEELDSE